MSMTKRLRLSFGPLVIVCTGIVEGFGKLVPSILIIREEKTPAPP